MNMMTGFSLLPLQLATMIGFVFTLFGLLVLVFVLGRYVISGTNVRGFPVPRVDHRDLLRSAALRARDHRRVPRTHAHANDGAAGIHRPHRNDVGRGMSEARPLCERLEWDSSFFGVSIARAVPTCADAAAAQTMLDWCHAHQIECLYFLADADDAASGRVLVHAGFTAVDERVTLELRDLRDPAGPPSDTHAVRPDDINALREIAAVSHRDSRFYHDGGFDPARCDELYRVWIENSCHGWADHVVVAESQGAAVGYLTLHLREPDSVSIGLIAVHPSFKRQGVGGHLLAGALAWSASRSATRVTVVTQGRNAQSRGFFLKAGFRPASRSVWYHRWFTRPDTEP